MKEPRLNELVIDDQATQQIRRQMAMAQSVKITINIGKSSLDILRVKAANRGAIPEAPKPFLEQGAAK